MEPLALYIHWPFCASKCPYCDFNSHVRDIVPKARFARALRTELAWEAARIGPRRLQSIFFGGGTPTLMDPADLADLIADAKAFFPPADDIEITLEANPTSTEREGLRAFRQAGVNRVSLGVQSLSDDALAMLGRNHSARDGIAALALARETFPRVSFDLIYARPGQTVPSWRDELRQALGLVADHVSLYQLTIEPGTAFESLHRRGLLVVPDDDAGAALYDATGEEAADAGLAAYEVSNYAAPGAESRHNLAYWTYRDYAGIGPGAHGRLRLAGQTLATRKHRAPEPWAELVERNGHGSVGEKCVSVADQAREMLMMGLRLSSGVSEAGLRKRCGIGLQQAVDAVAIRRFAGEGWMSFEDGTLRATPSGRLRLNSLLGAILA